MRTPFWLAVVLITGCGLLFGGEVRVVGVVEFVYDWETDSQQLGIEVPDTVSVGIPFTVSVTTGGNGCRRGGETVVEIVGNTATITPYDYSTEKVDGGSDDICTTEGRLFEHIAQVTFIARGAATVVVHSNVDYEFAVWVE